MPKLSLKNRILQLRVICVATGALAFIAVLHLCTFHGHYEYTHIPQEEIPDQLYRKTVPYLPEVEPPCQYTHVLNSTKGIDKSEIPTEFDGFQPTGLRNGSFEPACGAAFSVAILVTYRNRQKQLDIFLPYMHDFLRKQNIHYRIYLIEQRDEKPWNKGRLYNIGAKRAIADKFPCLILHDVDLLPLQDSILYACTTQPRHMSASIDKFRYVLPYEELVGGVLAVRADHYAALNGFSNRFQMWGGEDDDLSDRIKRVGLRVVRFPRNMARYAMLAHTPERRNTARRVIMEENRHRDYTTDGYSDVKYTAIEVSNHRMFTLVGVEL